MKNLKKNKEELRIKIGELEKGKLFLQGEIEVLEKMKNGLELDLSIHRNKFGKIYKWRSSIDIDKVKLTFLTYLIISIILSPIFIKEDNDFIIVLLILILIPSFCISLFCIYHIKAFYGIMELT